MDLPCLVPRCPSLNVPFVLLVCCFAVVCCVLSASEVHERISGAMEDPPTPHSPMTNGGDNKQHDEKAHTKVRISSVLSHEVLNEKN